jgi:hypothetical protein
MRQLEYSLFYPAGAWTSFIRFSEEPVSWTGSIYATATPSIVAFS